MADVATGPDIAPLCSAVTLVDPRFETEYTPIWLARVIGFDVMVEFVG